MNNTKANECNISLPQSVPEPAPKTAKCRTNAQGFFLLCLDALPLGFARALRSPPDSSEPPIPPAIYSSTPRTQYKCMWYGARYKTILLKLSCVVFPLVLQLLFAGLEEMPSCRKIKGHLAASQCYTRHDSQPNAQSEFVQQCLVLSISPKWLDPAHHSSMNS